MLLRDTRRLDAISRATFLDRLGEIVANRPLGKVQGGRDRRDVLAASWLPAPRAHAPSMALATAARRPLRQPIHWRVEAHPLRGIPVHHRHVADHAARMSDDPLPLLIGVVAREQPYAAYGVKRTGY